MRFATAFTLGITVVSTSASLVGRTLIVPACYTACVSLADTSDCPSSAATACLCTDQTYLTQVGKCLEDTCQGANLADSISLGETICLEAGVTLTATTAAPTAAPTSSSSPKSGSNPGSVKAAAIHHANLNSFAIGLATIGLVALAIY